MNIFDRDHCEQLRLSIVGQFSQETGNAVIAGTHPQTPPSPHHSAVSLLKDGDWSLNVILTDEGAAAGGRPTPYWNAPDHFLGVRLQVSSVYSEDSKGKVFTDKDKAIKYIRGEVKRLGWVRVGDTYEYDLSKAPDEEEEEAQ
jgi:hypothetical protein